MKHIPRTSRLVTTVAIATATLIGVAACSSGTGTPTSTASASGLKSILFVNPLPNYPQWIQLNKCVEAEAKKNGIAYTENGPAGGSVDANAMITRVQQGISTGYSALITWPDASPAAFDALFKTAKGKGMLVGTFYDGGSTTNQNVDVGTDFGEAAKQAVASLAKRKGQQNIGQITISDTAPAKTFTDALVAAAAKTKNVKLIASVFDGGDATKDVDLSVNMLTAHPEVNVLVSPEGAATPGMVSGVNQTNSKGKVVLVMNGTANGGSQALDAGIGYSASVSDICNAGKTMVDSLIKIKKGQTTPAFLPIPVLFVTKANYQHYVNTLGWS